MIDFIKTLFNSEEIIRTGGLLLVTLIVYVENGLFFGVFLPGDYLLFLAGLFCAINIFPVPIVLLTVCILTAAITGSFTGYFFGSLLGKKLYSKKDSLFFNRKYLIHTRFYYLKYGGKTLIISRFLPIVRTFAPILAGIVKMNFKKFLAYNILGGVVWVSFMVLGGFFLGRLFPGLAHYIEYIIFGFFGITSVIVLQGFLKMRQKKM